MARVMLIGANGQLGSDLSREIQSGPHDLVPLNRTDMDIRDHEHVADLLASLQPHVILNTAAFHKVEACELDAEQAFAVNSIAIRNLAIAANRIGAYLVHVSTDYVFDGEAGVPYPEEAMPNPVNVYGVSKAAGEFFVRSLCRRHLIIRTSGLYGIAGSSGKGGNFVQTMLRHGRDKGVVSVVTDQVLSPTYTFDLARTIRRLAETDAQGLYHVTNTGSCSWYEFAKAVFEVSGMQAEVRPIDTAASGSTASGSTVRRPAYSVLANRRLEREGYEPLPTWSAALKHYLHAVAGMEPSPVQAGVSNAAT